MNFKDFENDYSQLVGKTVLLSNRYNSSLHKIEKVTKTGFRISGDSSLFRLDNGWQKGGNSWSFSSCSLLTDEEANEYRAKWALAKEIRDIKEEVKTKLEILDIETLRKIKSIINP